MTRLEALAASPLRRARRPDPGTVFILTVEADGSLWRSRSPGGARQKVGTVAPDEAADDWEPVREREL